MATVPRGNATNVGASRLPYVSSGASANNFGAQKGQALQQVGQDLSQIGQQAFDIHRQNVQREAKNLYIEDKKLKRLLLQGDGTEENPGVLNMRGEDALRAGPLVEKALAEQRSKLLKNVSSQQVRTLFEGAVAEDDQPDLDRLFTHMAIQREAANDATDKALIEEAQNDAALNYHDSGKVDRALMTIGETIANQTSRKGLSTEVMQQEILSAYSSTIEKTIKAAAQVDTKAARRLQETYKDSLSGVDAADVDKYLEAKEEQDLNDRYTAENRSHTQTLRWQENNYNSLGSMVANNTATDEQLILAQERGLITFNQLTTLQERKKKLIEDGGDPDEFNRVKVSIRKGETAEEEILGNPLLDSKQQSTLLDVLKEVQIGGPTFGRLDIKNATKAVADASGGQRDMFGRYTAPADRAREGMAVDAFQLRIKQAQDAQETLTPARVAEIRDETIQAFKNDNLPAFASLAHLPQTPYLPRIIGLRPKAEWLKELTKATNRLTEDHSTFAITDDAYEAQLELLLLYKADIERLDK